MMTLDQMLDLGCYVNAGHVDHYDGKHTRIAEVLASGDLVYEKGGEEFINKLSMSAVTGALASEAVDIPTAASIVEVIVAPVTPPDADGPRSLRTWAGMPVGPDPLDSLETL